MSTKVGLRDPRWKSAAKLEVYPKWRAIVEKHEAAERKEMAALVHELVPYFKSNGYDLDVEKSYLAKRWHGSDGWRMEGMFTITEREENNVKATKPEQVKTWVEEATGLHGYPRKLSERPAKGGPRPGDPITTWQVEISED